MGRLTPLVARILLLAAALPAVPAAADGTWIYWSDYGNATISRVRPDGTGAETVLAGAGVPIGLAVDDTSGKIYWVDAGNKKVRRANFDGSSPEDVVSTGAGTPYGIAVDVAGGKVYWKEYPGGDGIQRANLDGTGVETILTTAGAGGLALDLDAGLLYWADYSAGTIGRVGLDGSSPQVLVGGRPNPNHVALDLPAGRLYWSEGVFTGRVMAADLDGTGVTTVVGGESSPAGLALDTSSWTLYWAAEDGHAVRRAQGDGSGLATLVAASSRPAGIAVSSEAIDATPPALALPLGVVAEATGADGAAVTYIVTATDEADPAPVVTCDPPSGAVFPPGESVVTCTATDAAGNESEGSFVVTVRDTTPPAFDAPPDLSAIAGSAAGSGVDYSVPAAADVVDGSVAVICAPASGSLFPLGSTTVHCSATDAAGNAATRQFAVRVMVSWSDVLQPINTDGSSIFKLGSTVPVKFRLAGDSAPISDLVARLYATKLSDGVLGTEVEAIATGAADSGNRFRYDAESGQYVFNWGTKPLTPGTYQLRIDTGDGVLRTVLVSLR